MRRPSPSSTWYARQKRRRESPFFRLLDRSFGFRVLMAAALSFVLLAVVNRFENCHAKAGQADCLTSNVLEIISIGTVESFSIVTAAIFYLLEAGQRKEKEHHEMLELLLAQRQAGASNSLGRLRALEMLSEDGIWQDGFDLEGSNLEGLRIPFGRWRRANFSGTVLRNADCHGADLAEADFSRADLTGANFRGADLRGANFTGANLSQTDLRGARVDGAEFRGAHLSRTLMDGPLPSEKDGASPEGR
ncbi:pentapeptide repeat-containing protein [Cyanobium gracile UHCC 0139]|uniref:Pentapeptide repeat-containing protein n=1 Tax=Cyanobium gracile UHCC 0139 TaxID=3110308 RepID=A0ABU5RUJ6_9CYAN|nr:pentapeptide repeat-containing protein [Cyanobium gracile]MEA5391408.1 pentapeptide repeat-containing protein [Cyanobium gracile UHCC 0139]